MIRFFSFSRGPKNRKNHIFKKFDFYNILLQISAFSLIFCNFSWVLSSKSLSFIKILILGCRLSRHPYSNDSGTTATIVMVEQRGFFSFSRSQEIMIKFNFFIQIPSFSLIFCYFSHFFHQNLFLLSKF